MSDHQYFIQELFLPSKDIKPYDIDFVVVRENTEGEYANVGGFQYTNFP